MLPILVLAFATSAFAAPGFMNIRQLNSNDVGPSDRTPVGLFFSLFDDGDALLNELNLGAVLRDLSANGNQAQTNGQAVAALGELATGKPGDACDAANLINAYTRYVSTGNSGGVREALGGYIQSLNAKIDNIVGLVTNKEAARFATGVQGGCPNGGRTYQFDAAWDIILGSSPNPTGLVQEEFCVAKRLYCGFSVRANNVGATITAAALPPTAQIFDQASGALSNFLSAAASKGNVGQAARVLKQALSSGVGRVNL